MLQDSYPTQDKQKDKLATQGRPLQYKVSSNIDVFDKQCPNKENLTDTKKIN